jgi:hypothetical protein
VRRKRAISLPGCRISSVADTKYVMSPEYSRHHGDLFNGNDTDKLFVMGRIDRHRVASVRHESGYERWPPKAARDALRVTRVTHVTANYICSAADEQEVVPLVALERQSRHMLRSNQSMPVILASNPTSIGAPASIVWMMAPQSDDYKYRPATEAFEHEAVACGIPGVEYIHGSDLYRNRFQFLEVRDGEALGEPQRHMKGRYKIVGSWW